MPKPWVHALVAGGVAAATYAVTHRPALAGAAFAAGTLIDADHLVDFGVVKATHSRRWIILPLHGWEYAAGLLLAGRWSPLALAAGTSYLIHLSLDQVFNSFGTSPGYSLVWRATKRFDSRNMGFSFEPHQWSDQPISSWFA